MLSVVSLVVRTVRTEVGVGESVWVCLVMMSGGQLGSGWTPIVASIMQLWGFASFAR